MSVQSAEDYRRQAEGLEQKAVMASDPKKRAAYRRAAAELRYLEAQAKLIEDGTN